MAYVANLGLRNSLFNILNKNEVGSTYYSLSKYLLENFNNINKLNIYDMVYEVNVSRSTINRFVKDLGYKNFVELKQSFESKRYLEHKSMIMNRDYSKYIELLKDDVRIMMNDLLKRMDTDEVVKICKKIHDSENVLFISSSSNAGVVSYFQNEFILLNKLIYGISNIFDNSDMINVINKSDYILVFSMSGRFANNISYLLEDSYADKTLITLSRDESLDNIFNQVYKLASKDNKHIDECLYNRYGITFMLDIIFNTYAYLYQ